MKGNQETAYFRKISEMNLYGADCCFMCFTGVLTPIKFGGILAKKMLRTSKDYVKKTAQVSKNGSCGGRGRK